MKVEVQDRVDPYRLWVATVSNFSLFIPYLDFRRGAAILYWPSTIAAVTLESIVITNNRS